MLGALEGRHVDEWLMGWGGGPDPVVVRIPAQLGLMAEGDVVDVDEDLVASLPVPDLVAGVAGIGQDGPDRALGPGGPGAVPVANGIGGRGGEDSVVGEAPGDGVQPAAGQAFGEDPLDDRGGVRVGFQLMETLTGDGLARVGMGVSVNEPVTVGGSATEEAAFGGGLGGHGRADPDLDAGPLSLGHAAVQGHDQVVGLGARIDRAAHLRHP